jgi:hypothetical protein
MTPLKEYVWQITGDKVLLTEELEMKNPYIKVTRVNYIVGRMLAMIDISFSEGIHWTTRRFDLQLEEGRDENIGAETIRQYITTLYPSAKQISPTEKSSK